MMYIYILHIIGEYFCVLPYEDVNQIRNPKFRGIIRKCKKMLRKYMNDTKPYTLEASMNTFPPMETLSVAEAAQTHTFGEYVENSFIYVIHVLPYVLCLFVGFMSGYVCSLMIKKRKPSPKKVKQKKVDNKKYSKVEVCDAKIDAEAEASEIASEIQNE